MVRFFRSVSWAMYRRNVQYIHLIYISKYLCILGLQLVKPNFHTFKYDFCFIPILENLMSWLVPTNAQKIHKNNVDSLDLLYH